MASPNGAKRAIAAGLNSIEYVVSAADAHSRANVGRDTAEATAAIADVTRIAHDNGATVEVIIATAWDCPFDGPTDRRSGCSTSPRRQPDLGVDRIAIADTIGTTTPSRVSSLIAAGAPGDRRHPAGRALPQHPRRRTGQCIRRGAGRGDPARTPRSAGWAVARSRPGASGNIATEDLVYLLRDSGIERRRRPAARPSQAAAVAQQVVGHELPSALLRAGDRILG